jgi:hypothetical protein
MNRDCWKTKERTQQINFAVKPDDKQNPGVRQHPCPELAWGNSRDATEST